ncbi:MAG: hypothetical protein AB7V43_19270 [Acidimicrobiia bacterium]
MTTRSSRKISVRRLALPLVVVALAIGLWAVPSGAARPRWSTSVTISPGAAAQGETVTITVNATSRSKITSLIEVELFDASGTQVFQQVWNKQAFRAGRARTFTTTWTVPTSVAPGQLSAVVGVFSTNWKTLRQWNDTGVTLDVAAGSAPGATAPGPAPSGTHFTTLPVGAALPSEAACASAVRKTPEARPQNATFNVTRGTSPADGYPRVTGNFTGTTDEIIQWASCKWGFDEDIARAQIAVESWWDMRTVGDQASGRPSFGLGQIRAYYHPDAFEDDNAKRSSAYNVDYMMQLWRSCYDGKANGVDNGYSGWLRGYTPGDFWGCIGNYMSGSWHDAAGEAYVLKVQDALASRVWTTPNFLSATS